jgi:oxidase EvaA
MEEISAWLHHQRLQSCLEVKRIPFSDCLGWSFHHGSLVHESGGFFSVRGCRFKGSNPGHFDFSMPMIDQPEVGLLGFVVRKDAHGWQWLLQAKTEPGCVGGTQIGPTVQATRSNWLRRHGGKPTPLLELFMAPDPGGELITDVEQSEQGDRFLGKYNRNAVVRVDEDLAPPEGGQWRWFPAGQLVVALGENTVVNTDSRSVLWCSDWRLLLPPGQDVPFQGWQGRGGFEEALLNSSLVPTGKDGDPSGFHSACAALEAMRAHTTVDVEFQPLEALQGWTFDDLGLHCDQPEGGWYDLRAVSVRARDREVPSWCQPMLESTAEQKVVLLCASKQGVLHFAFNLSAEPGFQDGVQFAPSLVTGPGHGNPPEWLEASADPGSIIRAATCQSDEGGRFLNSVAVYQILEVPAEWIDLPAHHGIWVTLSAAHRMASTRSLLNNELRSILSMLLSWV